MYISECLLLFGKIEPDPAVVVGRIWRNEAKSKRAEETMFWYYRTALSSEEGCRRGGERPGMDFGRTKPIALCASARVVLPKRTQIKNTNRINDHGAIVVTMTAMTESATGI